MLLRTTSWPSVLSIPVTLKCQPETKTFLSLCEAHFRAELVIDAIFLKSSSNENPVFGVLLCSCGIYLIMEDICEEK